MSDSELLDKISKVAGDRAKVMDLVLAHFDADTGTIHVLGPDGMLHLETWAGRHPGTLAGRYPNIPVGKGSPGWPFSAASLSFCAIFKPIRVAMSVPVHARPMYKARFVSP